MEVNTPDDEKIVRSITFNTNITKMEFRMNKQN